MELYYKDLISEEATLEKLVDDMLNVVQGVDELAEAAGATLQSSQREEVASRLQRLKESCTRIRDQAVSRARATDRVVRGNPYVFAGCAFALGLVAGVLAGRRWSGDQRSD